MRIAAGATACTYVLPTIIASFRREHPGVKVHLRETFTPRVHQAVIEGHVDLGIAQTGMAPLTDEPWRTDPLVLVASPDHPGNQCGSDVPLVAFTQGAALRKLMDAHFPNHEVAMELSSIASTIGAVRAGIGAALLSQLAVSEDVAAGRLKVLQHPKTPLQRKLVLVHQGVDRLAPAALAMRQMLLLTQDDGCA